ncbi:MAG: rhomboid family intramembrane serine protease, partial [Myxococcota bacterium]
MFGALATCHAAEVSADESRIDPHEKIWTGAVTVKLGPSSIWLPSGFAQRSQTEVPFASFRRIVMHRDGTELIILTPDRTYTLEARLVGGPEVLADIATATQRRIVQHPQSSQWIAQLARFEALDRAALRRPARASRILVGLCVAVFAIQFMWGAALPSIALWFGGDGGNAVGMLPLRWSKMLAMGANAPSLVAKGEYFRLATANLLHADIVHAVVNLAGLRVLGPMVERLWGPWRFLIVFLSASIGGAAASTWWSMPLISVGASTGLMGLLGAYFVLWLRHRHSMPPSFVISSDRWITLAIINGILWWSVSSIDHWGHFGGALVGGLCALVMRSPTDTLQTSTPQRGAQIVGTALLAIFALAVGQAAWTASERPLSEPLSIMLSAEATRSPVNANNVAWAIATDPRAKPSLLRAAERAARTAVTHSDDDNLRAHCLDTHATVLYRLGRFRQAV